MKPGRLLARLATSQANVRFTDLCRLAEALGFEHDRTAGSHRIFIHRVHKEAQLNLQPDRGQVKPCPVRQLLRLVEEHDHRLDEDA